MTFGVVSMSCMAIGAKLLGLYTEHNVFKVAFFRSLIMFVGSYSHGRFLYNVKPFSISKDMANMMFWRGLFGTAAFMFELAAIYYLPVSIAVVLYFTQPIFTGIMGYIFLKEKLSNINILGIVCGIIGVLIISFP